MEHVRPLVDTAADQLVDYIINNSLSRGARLPNEFELAKHLGVGRSTLRQAVILMVRRKVFELPKGSGTVVTGMTTTGISADTLGRNIYNG